MPSEAANHNRNQSFAIGREKLYDDQDDQSARSNDDGEQQKRNHLIDRSKTPGLEGNCFTSANGVKFRQCTHWAILANIPLADDKLDASAGDTGPRLFGSCNHNYNSNRTTAVATSAQDASNRWHIAERERRELLLRLANELTGLDENDKLKLSDHLEALGSNSCSLADLLQNLPQNSLAKLTNSIDKYKLLQWIRRIYLTARMDPHAGSPLNLGPESQQDARLVHSKEVDPDLRLLDALMHRYNVLASKQSFGQSSVSPIEMNRRHQQWRLPNGGADPVEQCGTPFDWLDLETARDASQQQFVFTTNCGVDRLAARYCVGSGINAAGQQQQQQQQTMTMRNLSEHQESNFDVGLPKWSTRWPLAADGGEPIGCQRRRRSSFSMFEFELEQNQQQQQQLEQQFASAVDGNSAAGGGQRNSFIENGTFQAGQLKSEPEGRARRRRIAALDLLQNHQFEDKLVGESYLPPAPSLANHNNLSNCCSSSDVPDMSLLAERIVNGSNNLEQNDLLGAARRRHGFGTIERNNSEQHDHDAIQIRRRQLSSELLFSGQQAAPAGRLPTSNSIEEFKANNQLLWSQSFESLAPNNNLARLEYNQRNHFVASSTFRPNIEPFGHIGRTQMLDDDDREARLFEGVNFYEKAEQAERDQCLPELFQDCVGLAPAAEIPNHSGNQDATGSNCPIEVSPSLFEVENLMNEQQQQDETEEAIRAIEDRNLGGRGYGSPSEADRLYLFEWPELAENYDTTAQLFECANDVCLCRDYLNVATNCDAHLQVMQHLHSPAAHELDQHRLSSMSVPIGYTNHHHQTSPTPDRRQMAPPTTPIFNSSSPYSPPAYGNSDYHNQQTMHQPYQPQPARPQPHQIGHSQNNQSTYSLPSSPANPRDKSFAFPHQFEQLQPLDSTGLSMKPTTFQQHKTHHFQSNLTALRNNNQSLQYSSSSSQLGYNNDHLGPPNLAIQDEVAASTGRNLCSPMVRQPTNHQHHRQHQHCDPQCSRQSEHRRSSNNTRPPPLAARPESQWAKNGAAPSGRGHQARTSSGQLQHPSHHHHWPTSAASSTHRTAAVRTYEDYEEELEVDEDEDEEEDVESVECLSLVPSQAKGRLPMSIAEQMSEQANKFVLSQGSRGRSSRRSSSVTSSTNSTLRANSRNGAHHHQNLRNQTSASPLNHRRARHHHQQSKPNLQVRRTLRVKIKKSKPILGIAIEGGFNVSGQLLPRIVCVHEEGAAYQCGKLRASDLILEINGISTVNMTHDDIARTIANAYYQEDRPYIEFLIGESVHV